MKSPFFSIIIPVYKVKSSFLKECIDSVLSQSFVDFELILVDDGSPDDCGRICDVYAERDSRIRVIHQENQGVSVARNSGISSAQGEWIFFVDADDWIEANTLEILWHQVDNNICDILIFRLVKNYQKRYEELEYGLQSNHLYDMTCYTNKEFFYRRVMNIPYVNNGKSIHIYYSFDKIFRRSFLKQNGVMYVRGLAKSEDKIFISQCFEKARYIYYIDAQLYHYRIHDESICHRYSSNLDVQRKMMADYLKQIAVRMDAELGKMCNDKSYKKITEDYRHFLFGIISDVLLLQYYHEDNPNKKQRRKDAIAFLESEPFKSTINALPYKTLSKEARLKKFLLQHNLVSLFCLIKKMKG